MLQTYDERNADLIVNVNGALLHRDVAGVSLFDSAVQNGDAVWEGLRLYDGRIFRLSEHLARLRRSAEALSYADVPTDEQIIAQLRRTLEVNGMRDGVHVRLTLSRGVKCTSGLDPRLNTMGPTLIVLAEHKPPVFDRSGIRLITAAHRRPPADVLDQRIHSCNQLTSILAKLEANAAGADDALLLDTRGFIAETSSTHVFLVEEGAVRTPTTAACPGGITRATVLELCAEEGIPCVVEDIAPESIARSSEMFCTGTMGELVPVLELDGRTVGAGAIGPVTRRLSAMYQALTRTEGTPVV